MGINSKFNITKSPFLFPTNNGGGGSNGGSDILYSPIVWVNPFGDDGTGQRNNFSKPFATLDGAKAVALPGDTIFVNGGTYNQSSNCYVPEVRWYFLNTVVNFDGPIGMFDDEALPTPANIEVYGNGIFNQTNLGQFIFIGNLDSTLYFEAESVTSLGFHQFLLFECLQFSYQRNH